LLIDATELTEDMENTNKSFFSLLVKKLKEEISRQYKQVKKENN